MRSYRILTFGCQMNEHDSEKMSGVLEAGGFMSAGSIDDADVVVINTCSIREKAEQKFYSELGRLRPLKESNPSLIIAVSGCIAQQEGRRILRRAPYVDLILGNQNIKDLPELIEAKRRSDAAIRTEFDAGYEHITLPVRRTSSVTAFVNIMYGCDNFCSYCVVPHVRGREKSRMPGEVVGEVRGLVGDGCREVTLLGQNVNSYGRGLDCGCGFPELLSMLDGVEGLERLRFVTSHPKDLSDALVEAMASLSKVCECIHLPLQSASDNMLRAMNRKYSFSEYMEKLNKLRAAMPDIALSTDIIVGFPGETEDDYRKTVDALTEIRYDSIFSFKYSMRPNTAALKMPGHLDEGLKDERLYRVIELQNRITEEKNEARVGRVEEVLVEGPESARGEGRMRGKTRGNKIVNFDGELSLRGRLVRVKITEAKKHSLVGELV